MNGSLSICPSCKHWNGMYCQHQGIGCGYEWEDKMPKTYIGNSGGSAPITLQHIIRNGDFSEFKADSWGNEPQTIPPIETELYINNEPIGKHLAEVDRLLTEAINLSYVSGENTKAQMRDKIIEARRITEEIKRIK